MSTYRSKGEKYTSHVFTKLSAVNGRDAELGLHDGESTTPRGREGARDR